VTLGSLATDLLARIVSRCDSPADIHARTAGVSRLFRDAQPSQSEGGAAQPSIAEHAVCLRAQERGYELPAPPTGSRALPWLCIVAMQREANLLSTTLCRRCQEEVPRRTAVCLERLSLGTS